MDTVERLAAIEDIKRAKARYFRGVDEKSETLLRSIFSDDVELDFRGASTDPITGFTVSGDVTSVIQRGGDHCAKVVSNALLGVVSVHHGSVPEIEIIDENNANGIWPMVDRLRFNGEGEVLEMIGYGYYYETYIKERGEWRIRTMKLTRTRIDLIPNDGGK